MLLLAIETATRRGSVALVEDGRVIDSRALAEGDHGRTLALEVQALCGAALGEIGAYGLSIGPGSFTGLRVGLSFVKGLALVTGRPVVPVSTLLVLAAQAGADRGPIVPLMDARGGEVFAAWYAGGDLTPDPRLPEGLHRIETVHALVAASSGEPGIVTGDAVPQLLQAGLREGWAAAPETSWVPDARTLGRLAFDRWIAGHAYPAETIEPAYHQLSGPERKIGHRSDGVTKETPSR